MSVTVIKSVVFDVGGVLVDLRYQGFIKYLGMAGVDMTNLPAWLTHVDLAAHERGEVPTAVLMDRIASLAKLPLDRDELEARWVDMFERSDEMIDLATGLMRDYRVYLLSNVGERHWAHLDGRYGLDNLVHGAVASFRVGAVKPEPAIYRKTEEMFGLEPATTVFVDDLPPNIAAAREHGWHAIHHTDPRTTRAALRALGVRLPDQFAHEV